MARAVAAVDDRGVFHLALSGGSTPEPFCLRLLIDLRYHDIPWKQTPLWLVNAHRVPDDHEMFNFK